MDRVCTYCNSTFTPSHGNQKLCSVECKKANKLNNSRRYRGVNPSRKIPCRHCGLSFIKNHPNDRYCSDLCRAEQKKVLSQVFKKKYPEKAKEYHNRCLYRLEPEEYQDLIKDGCEVCGTKENLVVDHCHETGKVRGCLCNDHNLALGKLGDSSYMVSRLLGYIREREHAPQKR